MVTFREGGGGNLLKISTIHRFLCIRIAEGKFLGGFFFPLSSASPVLVIQLIRG